MKDMAKWQYGNGYKMLIIADSADTYKRLRVAQETVYPHIRIATPAEILMATNLAAETMKVMADSLVSNWDNHYSTVDTDGKKWELVNGMRELLTENGEVQIPTFPNEDGQEPKLYLIDYEILYKDKPEGAKYITDPFAALVKSAVNLSFFTTKEISEKRGCKFLPGCLSPSSSGEEESARSVDLHGSPPKTSFQELIGKEIELHFVSDDEFDDDDDITQ